MWHTLWLDVEWEGLLMQHFIFVGISCQHFKEFFSKAQNKV
jgi:hypothetical protein